MYSWREKTKNGGVPGFTFFRDLLAGYLDLPFDSKQRWMRNSVHRFRKATMDFMQLQCLDYETAFWCDHASVRLLAVYL